MIKYAVEPGYVESKNDNELHFISFHRLCKLYNVDPKECIDISKPENRHGLDMSKLKYLCPRTSGNYLTPS